MIRTPDWWDKRSAKAFALLPLAALYGLGNWLDRRFTTPHAAKLPTIVVGNAVAGGAGKTPATLTLARILTGLGETPHIVSRGYGGSQFAPHRVEENDDWNRVGDEALLLAKAAPTWVGRDRLASTTAAWENGASLALCDDALQHYKLKPDLAFLVVDGAFGFGNRFYFPAGPLREPISNACERADAMIVIDDDKHHVAAHARLPVFAARLEPSIDTGFLREGKWFAFAGLARPEKFFNTLYALGAKVAGARNFPDHYPYSEADIAALEAEAQKLGAKLITTEKDGVKLPPGARARLTTLPVTLHFADEAALRAWLQEKLQKIRGA